MEAEKLFSLVCSILIYAIILYLFVLAKDEFDLESSGPSPKLKRQAFTLDFKLQVIEAAKKSSNREQARIHNIHESVIRRWRKQISEESIKEIFNSPDKMTLRFLPITINKQVLKSISNTTGPKDVVPLYLSLIFENPNDFEM